MPWGLKNVKHRFSLRLKKCPKHLTCSMSLKIFTAFFLHSTSGEESCSPRNPTSPLSLRTSEGLHVRELFSIEGTSACRWLHGVFLQVLKDLGEATRIHGMPQINSNNIPKRLQNPKKTTYETLLMKKQMHRESTIKLSKLTQLVTSDLHLWGSCQHAPGIAKDQRGEMKSFGSFEVVHWSQLQTKKHIILVNWDWHVVFPKGGGFTKSGYDLAPTRFAIALLSYAFSQELFGFNVRSNPLGRFNGKSLNET